MELYILITILIKHLIECEHYMALHDELPSFEQWKYQLILDLCTYIEQQTYEKQC